MLVFVNIGNPAWTNLLIILYKRGNIITKNDNFTERLDIFVQYEALTLSVDSYDFPRLDYDNDYN